MKAIIATLLFLLIISCKKEESVYAEFEGYAVDKVSGDSVPGVNVEIWEDDNSHATFFTYKKVTASVKTDEHGYYKIRFELPSYDVRLAVNGTHPKYLNQNNLGPTIRITSERLLNIQVPMFPLSWTKFHIRNVPPFLSSDSVRFLGGFTMRGNIDTTIIYQSALKIDEANFFWYGSANGNSFSESIGACQPFDTCTVNIDF